MNTLTVVKAVQTTLHQANVPLNDKPGVSMLLCAEHIARELLVPTGPVTDPRAHFNVTCYADAMKKLGMINEHLVIDLDRCVDLVARFWLTRYRLVHEPQHPSIARLILCAHGKGNLSLAAEDQRLLETYCLRPVASTSHHDQ